MLTSEISRPLKITRDFKDSASANTDFFVLYTREYVQIRTGIFYVNL